MAWFNAHQDDNSQDIYGALTYEDGYDIEALIQLTELIKTKQFQHDEITTLNFKNALQHIFLIIDGFKSAAASLLKRRKNKIAVTLVDEYDMQDLLLVMLRASFPWVKSEQVTEGNSDRHFLKIDFLIPDSKIAIETKFYKGGNVKDLTDQLDIDIQTYHRHPDCRYLVFFVYDKDLLITDAKSLERQHEQVQTFGNKQMNIYLKIRPRN